MNGFNPAGQTLKSNADGLEIDRAFLAHLQVAAADAVAASNTGVHEGIILAEGSGSTLEVNLTSPKAPRALRIKGNAAGIAGNVIIEGTNYAGAAISETIALNGSTAVEGAKAFKTVTKITVPAKTNASGDTVVIGWNDKLGLPYKLSHNTVLAAYLDNIKEATAATVAVSASAVESNTVDLSSALNGKAVDIYFMV
jgi:hypothetical protein